MLLNAFQTTIFPYFVQIGSILFVYSMICLGYRTFRSPSMKELVDGLKGYTFAYCLVKGAFTIIHFIDKIIDGIK